MGEDANGAGVHADGRAAFPAAESEEEALKSHGLHSRVKTK